MYISLGGEAQESSIRKYPGGPLTLGELQGSHTAKKDFPDPEACWAPSSKAKPNWGKTMLRVEGELIIPSTCNGSITARTILRDVLPGQATGFADDMRFGVSDGTHTGGLEKATKVSSADGTVVFEQTIPWDGQSCTAKNDLFVYVKWPEDGTYTFIEVAYYPRIKPDNKGGLIDNSPPPAIRLNPCDNLKPIRSTYIPGKMSQKFRLLSGPKSWQVTKETGRRFSQETSVTRKLDKNNPKDLPLIRQWLRIRDEVMTEK